MLQNKIGAITQSQLNKIEAEITYIIITTLTVGSRPDKLKFDYQLLCDMHKEIFGDIYKWAGKIRTQDISKEESYFAHATYIQPSLEALLRELNGDRRLESKDSRVFIQRIAYYYSELNAVHPFREGNGRVIRTFLRLLALKYNYDIDWSKMDPDDNVEASKKALSGDVVPMRKMLSGLITKLAD